MSDHNILRGFRAWVGLSVAILLWVEPFSPPKSFLGVSECHAQGCPDEDSPSAVEQAIENPETHLGCRIVVQGILYRFQGVDQILYSI
jgi:hypothetical protein